MDPSKGSVVPTPTLAVLPAIIAQHIDAAAELRATRSALLRAPNVNPYRLAAHDERLRAHLDGVSVAGEHGYRFAQRAAASSALGQMFVLGVAAIERRDREQMERLIALVDDIRDAERAIVSAVGWVSARSLEGLAATLLTSLDAKQRRVGIAACGSHGVDVGPALGKAIESADPGVRVRALRAAGQLGRLDCRQSCLAHLDDAESHCRFEAARSGALLGAGPAAAASLGSIAEEGGACAPDALQMLVFAASRDDARTVIRRLTTRSARIRQATQAVGWSGDIGAMDWLLHHMSDDLLARVAGEAFTTITGAQLAPTNLERAEPGKFDAGPNDNPDDDNVAMDPDDGLPWPDVAKISAWWSANRSRFTAGTRYFMGAPPTREHCIDVLKNGFQRQRMAAALHLCLLDPGTPFFNTAAPAWRQQRLLAKMH